MAKVILVVLLCSSPVFSARRAVTDSIEVNHETRTSGDCTIAWKNGVIMKLPESPDTIDGQEFAGEIKFKPTKMYLHCPPAGDELTEEEKKTRYAASATKKTDIDGLTFQTVKIQGVKVYKSYAHNILGNWPFCGGKQEVCFAKYVVEGEDEVEKTEEELDELFKNAECNIVDEPECVCKLPGAGFKACAQEILDMYKPSKDDNQQIYMG